MGTLLGSHNFLTIIFFISLLESQLLGVSGTRDPKLDKKCSKSVHLNSDKPKEAKFTWEQKSSVEQKCTWNVVGSKVCHARIQCTLELTKVDDDCSDAGAFVKVTDGSGGTKTYCGETSFKVSTSEEALRDLYLVLNVPESYTGKGIKCEASCSETDPGERLPKNLEKKRDLRCVCGLQNKDDRIVGGEDAMLNEFPWQSAVVFAKTRSPNCGASVINDRFVLTAAHCFWFDKKKPEQIEVLIHAHTLDMTKKKSAKDVALGKDGSIRSSGYDLAKKTDEDEKTQRFKVMEIINHPLFNEYYDFDIALLRLDRKINLADPDAPTPVCLPPSNVFDTLQAGWTDKPMTVVGWGLAAENAGGTTRVLQKVDLPFIDDKTCKSTNPDLITSRMVCAGYMDGTAKDACTGDSGGPMIYKQPNKQFIQTGIVSWGEGCARKGKPGVFSKVTEMMQWVMFHTHEADAKWCQDDK